jgi:tetratricopeptide (TPR) repeat protein
MIKGIFALRTAHAVVCVAVLWIWSIPPCAARASASSSETITVAKLTSQIDYESGHTEGAQTPEHTGELGQVRAGSDGPTDRIVTLLNWMDVSVESLLTSARNELTAGTMEGRETAGELFLNAIHLAPHDSRGYVGMVDTWIRGLRSNDLSPERTAAAIAFARKAVWREPQNADAHFTLANAYFRQFWFRLSIEHLLRAWDIRPEPRSAYWLGWMYSEIGELHEILPWLGRALELDPLYPGLAAELGYAHRVLGNFREAEHWLQKAADEDAGIPYPHVNLILLYLMLGRDDEALSHADRLIGFGEKNPVFLGNAGLTYWYTGHTERARELLEEAASADPLMWIGTWGTIVTQPLGVIYRNEGRKEEARAAFANAVAGYRLRFERASEGWGYRYDLAGIAAVQGQYEEAYAWLSDAIEFGWTDYALARRDPALIGLREDTRFQEMMLEVENKVTGMREMSDFNGGDDGR